MPTAKRRPRLNRQDWINLALNTLVHEGIGAVTVDRLASGLGITRGSFYHHFADRNDLLDALLAHWADGLTLAIREQVASLHLDPATTLLVLLRTIRAQHAAEYDAPFRAWALHDERAARVLAEVDEVRLAFIRQQFEALGFRGVDLENRTRLLLYHEIAAPAMFLSRDEKESEERMLERLRFLSTPGPEASPED